MDERLPQENQTRLSPQERLTLGVAISAVAIGTGVAGLGIAHETTKGLDEAVQVSTSQEDFQGVADNDHNQTPLQNGPAEISKLVDVSRIDVTDPEFPQFAMQQNGSVYNPGGSIVEGHGPASASERQSAVANNEQN